MQVLFYVLSALALLLFVTAVATAAYWFRSGETEFPLFYHVTFTAGWVAWSASIGVGFAGHLY